VERDGVADRFRYTAESLQQLFWFDLFDWQSTIGVFSGRLEMQDSLHGEMVAVEGIGPPSSYQCTEALNAGDWVVLTHQPATIRRATPDEIPQQEPTNG
jgi:hypothetical protein